MKKNKFEIKILIIYIIGLLLLTGCSNKSTMAEDTKTKIIQELEYLDVQLVGILNDLNNITLQNYTVTSEEITLEEQSASTEGSGSKQSEKTGAAEAKESNSQKQPNGDNQSTTITTTQTEQKIILDLNENDIKWKQIKGEIEIISNSWGIILLDLSTLNVDSNDILTFSKVLNEDILSIKNEDKITTLTNTAELYSLIPKFEKSISAPNNIQNAKQVKSFLLKAYSLVEQDNWIEIESNIAECEKNFKSLMNDVEYIKDKEYKINKTYVLIKELKNSLVYKDKKLFYVKYKDLLESINIL